MPAKKGAMYTIGFAAAVCLVCGIAVSSLSVALKPAQDANRKLDRQKNVLIAAGLIDPAENQTPQEITKLFGQRIKQVETDSGKQLYEVIEGASREMFVLPVEGKGLWSTIYGFLALDADTTTIRGIAFYQHGETPGLGGEIENPKWRALWKNRKAFDQEWKPAIRIIKGLAGSPQEDPHKIDGLSGATLTSNGVSDFVQHWLGEEGYGPYLAAQRAGGGE